MFYRSKKFKIFVSVLLSFILLAVFAQTAFGYEYTSIDYGKAWKPDGSSVERKMMARIRWDITTNNATTYKISVQGQGGINKDNVGATLSGKLTMSGAASGTASGTRSYTYNSKEGSGDTGSDACHNFSGAAITKSITKTHSTQTLTLKFVVSKTSGSVATSSSYNATATKTLTIPAKDSYTVTLNGNGGSSTSATKWYGEDLSLSSYTSTRSGYRFKGWYTAASGGTQVTTYTTNSATTLYAQWEQDTYYVLFDSNGHGTGTYKEATLAGTITAPSLSYIDSGSYRYVFSYWSKYSSGGSPYYYAGNTVKYANQAPIADTFYAQWVSYRYGSITLNPASGTYNGKTTSSTITVLESYSQGNNPGPATRSGYVFEGWYTGQNKTGYKVFDSNGRYTTEGSYWSSSGYWNDNTTSLSLYAGWTEEKKDYTLTLDPKEGSYSQSTTKTVTIGSTNNNSIGIPTKDGYAFKGWYTSASGGTQVYDDSGNYTTNGGYWTSSGEWNSRSDLNLYAQWSSSVNLILNPYNGTYNGTTASTTKTIEYNSVVASVKSATRSGYRFEGWYTAATDGTKVFDINGDPVKDTVYIDSNGRWQYLERSSVVVYARWTKLSGESHVITFDPAGGTFQGTQEPSTKDVSQNNVKNNTVALPRYVGHNFNGWYDSSGNMVYDAEGKCTTQGNYWSADGTSGVWQGQANLSLTARWTERTLYTYTVTYDANGGSNPPETQTKTEGAALTLTRDKPTWSRHRFLKWNTKANGSGTNYSPGEAYVLDEDVTLYAQWEEVTEVIYTITYRSNGDNVSGVPDEQSKTEGVDETLSSSIPTREGYEFDKWNTRANGTGTDYAPGDTYSADDDVILYAIWIENPASASPKGTRILIGIGKTNAARGSSASVSGGKDYGDISSMKGEGYQYELYKGSTPDGTLDAERALKAGYEYHVRSIAFKQDGNYGYHFIGLLGGIIHH